MFTENDRYVAGLMVGSLYWHERLQKRIGRPQVASHLAQAFGKPAFMLQNYIEQMEERNLIYHEMDIRHQRMKDFSVLLRRQDMLEYVLTDYAEALDMSAENKSLVIKAMSFLEPCFTLQEPSVLPIQEPHMTRREDITLLQGNPAQGIEDIIHYYQ